MMCILNVVEGKEFCNIKLLCLLKFLMIQVSRLIKMQTPFYLEGVHYLHPFYQTRHQGFEEEGTNIGPPQLLS